MLHPVAPEHGAPKGISKEEKKGEAIFEKFDKPQSNGSSEYLVTPANKGRRMEVGHSHVFGIARINMTVLRGEGKVVD
ncbi:UNVERIFIED_CONTAM: hypothetical protein Sangu_2894400 [Sesamum angustifolium]|uniref:Uncharacterized protein n=1 Tax=Sesamum angustifolium TaxID=2727405 RepID=A0AAW2IP73_9LAMI